MSKKTRNIVLMFIAVILVGVGFFFSQQARRASANAFLEKYQLAGLGVKDVVSKLDGSIIEPAELKSSITGTELILSDNSSTVKMALPDDSFYLSFAPYLNSTHPCGTHSLASCRGELVNKQVHATITEKDGQIILDSDVTTQPNGFVGVWLPRNIEATLSVSFEGKVAQADISTFANSDTCLTTPLKLN